MKWTGLVVVLLATAALADVPVDADALEYVGAFEGAAPGSVVTVALWDARTGGTAACPPVSAVVTGTRFVASLNAQCVARIRGAAPLFVEVIVGAAAAPRMQLRAVPYAVEAGRSATTSQILSADTTITVNPSGGAQFTSLQAAWDWVRARVVRARLTIQLADGTYNLPTSGSGFDLSHPDGINIQIIGNTTTPQNVLVNAPKGLRVEGTRLGRLNGMKIVGPGGAAVEPGLHVVFAGSLVAGPAIQLENFVYPVIAEGNGMLHLAGGTVTCVPASGGTAIRASANSYVQVDGVTVSSCVGGINGTGASSVMSTGVTVNGATSGWVASQASSVFSYNSQVSGVTTTFYAEELATVRVSNPPSGSTYSPASNVVGNRNAIIVGP